MIPDSPVSPQLDPAALLDGLPDPFFAVDGGWRFTLVNRRAAALLGVTPADLLGRVLWDCFSGAPETEYRRVMQTRQGRQFDLHDPALGLWLEVRAFPHADGIAVHFRDVTDRRLLDERREALLLATQALAGAGSVAEAAGVVFGTAGRVLGASGGTLWQLNGERLEPWEGEEAPLPVGAASPVARALHEPEGVFLRERDLLDAWPAGPDLPRAFAALPLGTGGETIGVLALRFGTDRVLGEWERDFLRSLAAGLAHALGRTRMAAANARALAALDRERARLHAILDQMPAAIWIAEVPGGRIVAGNRAVEGLLRIPYRPSRNVEEYAEYVGFHPDGRRYEGHEWPLARTVLTGERVGGEEIEMERGDGTRGFVRYASALIEDGGDGGPALAVVTGVDVTELRELSARLEERVEARTRELRARMGELAAETAALQAFASFTELAGHETDPAVLTQAAAGVLHRALGEGSTGYYERGGELWRQTAWDGDMEEGTLLAAQAGFPADMPLLAGPAASRGPLFVEDWRASDHVLAPLAPEYGAVAIYPVTVQGETVGLLAAGLREKTRWGERDRAVFRAVGRALSLAAERAHLTRVLHLQKEALEARGSVLEAFAELGRDLSLHRDPLDLVRRAQEILRGILPEGYLVYAEPEGDRWRFRVQVGDLGSPALRAAVEAGLPFEETRNLSTPWHTRQPLYQDRYDVNTDGLEDLTTHVTTTASLPVLVNGEPRGVLAVALFESRPWQDTDRMILETVVRSLGLALERAEAARALAGKQAQLEAANRDLEAFASSASHDLRAPVRHIASFAGLLRRAVAGDPRAARYAQIIEESARRMAALIDSLLAFARLGSAELHKSEVALAEVVEAVRQELFPELSGRRVEWRVGELPVVRGDPTLLRQVLQNLLGNAVKYSRTREVAVVEVWAERAGAEHVLHVRDNGVGFDPGHAGQVFEVFRRLHSPQEFEGDGVGLASVQRIVTRHGGRVWAEGEPGRGATFSFSLPADP